MRFNGRIGIAAIGVLIVAGIIAAILRRTEENPSPAAPRIAQPAEPQPPAVAPLVPAQAPARTQPPAGQPIVEKSPGRVRIQATDPESLKAAIEQLRADPETAGLADELESTLNTFNEMIASGVDREQAARILEKGLTDSLTKQYRARQGGNPQIQVRIQ